MNPSIKCPKPCEMEGKLIYCHHNWGKYTFVNCELYQQQLENERMIQLNDIGLVRVINAKGEVE